VSHHHLKVRLRDIFAFEQDGLRDTFHTVFNQELVHVSTFVLKEVIGGNFSEHELDVELGREAFMFAELENGFL
jgi:hypothetical protein